MIRPTRPATIRALLPEGVCAAAGGLALLSGVLNLLALTAPLFMLQVYDRVLASRSLPTLAGLAILALGLYAVQAALDLVRGRALTRMGELLDHALSGPMQQAVVRAQLEARDNPDGLQPLRDLDTVRGFLAGQGAGALLDLPWMPLYLALCFLLHVWIGVTALAGALVLLALALLGEVLSRRAMADAILSGIRRTTLLDAARRNAEAVCAMGLAPTLAESWHVANGEHLAASRRASDISGAISALSRALRIALQSGMLAVGALLVIEQQASGGIMIASSVLMGRALAPVDMVIGSWKGFIAARQSWARLSSLLARFPLPASVTPLPPPRRELRVEGLSIAPPGSRKASVQGVSFTLAAGSALGIVGPSGCGKSTLARALVGVWAPLSGKVRLDGAPLEQWDRAALGRHLGYLPQSVDLFAGTVAENIARLSPDADPDAIVAAGRAAGAHEMILRLEKGYDTPIGEQGQALSAGQRQRIGLARALFGDPFLVVMDEPNANLDAEGEAAVVAAIAAVRARGGLCIVIAHRPSALGAVDRLLLMEPGRPSVFGARDDVLAALRNAQGQQASRPLRVVPDAPSPIRIEETGHAPV